MKTKKIPPLFWITVLVWVALTVVCVWGVSGVPFHPDESSQLFMSADLEVLLSRPWKLAWQPGMDPLPYEPYTNARQRQLYRELDAPLTRYLLGLSRVLTGQTALPRDWNWGQDWASNQAAGALPDPSLLFAGRMAITLLLPISLLVIYRLGFQMGGMLTGLLALLLFGLNPLVLLHNRRAMAEGALSLGVLFAVISMFSGSRRPWLVGLGLALAFNAKQSTLALLPVGLLAVVTGFDLPTHTGWGRVRRSLWNVFICLGVFVCITLALNPIYWNQPGRVLSLTWQARQNLMQRQVKQSHFLKTGQALDKPVERVAAMLANLYFLQPAFAEISNYHSQTAASEQAYLQIAIHRRLGGLTGGGVAFLLTIFGMALSGLRLRKCPAAQRRVLYLVWLAGISQCVALLISVPLSWQRYVMPLIPFVCLWIAYGLASILQAIPGTRAIFGGWPDDVSG